ncbi:ABC transporter permease subunit [Bifidobacterium tsurumiense]|uniref:ABC-type Na efflux pump, permease component n=1 Tax=Bifidobacterium tsurumiense TaxID=356829 RepID=A0A087EHZ8_9BIFI|nr:ABC transporter permease [Bifidobacterium tsurumiense]KFJ07399.1 ABC-type Na efflux pump, permease component [Bifidobacterium tsurumiense]MDY4677402.1 ABC transporter permease [Bifidobacterium tsurumiense]
MSQMHSNMNSSLSSGYTTGRRMSSRRIRLNFWGCVRAEFIKSMSLVSTWWMIGIAIVLFPALTALQTGLTRWMSEQAPQDEMFSMDMTLLWNNIAGACGLAAFVLGIFGVMNITTEYTTTSIQSTLTVNPRRLSAMFAKCVALVGIVWVTTLVGVLLAIGAFYITSAGMSLGALPEGQAGLPYLVILGAPSGVAAICLIGCGLGAICRSTIGGVLALIGLLSILPSIFQMLSIFAVNIRWLGAAGYYLPSYSLSNFVLGRSPAAEIAYADSSDLGWGMPVWWVSGLVLLTWTVVIYAIGMLIVKRSDIK